MAQGSLPSQQDMEVDLRRQLNDVFGKFDDFAGIIGEAKQLFGVVPTSGVMRGLTPYSVNRLPPNSSLPSASLCLQEMKNVPPLIPPLQVNRQDMENSGCASEASSSNSQTNDDENDNRPKKRKRDRENDVDCDGITKRKEKKEDNKMMRDLFDDDNDDEKEDWKDRGNNLPKQGIKRMIENMQVQPLLSPIDADRILKKNDEEEEREEGEKRRKREREESEKRRKDKNEVEDRNKRKYEEEESKRKKDDEDDRRKDDRRRRKEEDERKRKREEEEREKEKKRKENDEKRKRKDESEREEEEKRIRKEKKRMEKEEKRLKEEEERIKKEEEIERKRKEEEEEKKKKLEIEEEIKREKENREREELANKIEEEKKKEAERIRKEEEKKKEVERTRREEEIRKRELEERRKRKEDDDKRKKEDDDRLKKEKKREEEKRKQKEEDKEKKRKEEHHEKGRKEKKGYLLLDALSNSQLEAIKEKEKEREKKKKEKNGLSGSKDDKSTSSSMWNEKNKKEDKLRETKTKELERTVRKEVSSARSSPMSSKNSSRVATPIPPLSLPSTSTHNHGGGISPSSSCDIRFSFPHCPSSSCLASSLSPQSIPTLEERGDIEGYTSYAKEKKHKGDATADRVLRFCHYMESCMYFALSVSSYSPSKSSDRELSMAGCVLKDTIDLIKHAMFLFEKEGMSHMTSRTKLLCTRTQAILNYHMYFLRTSKVPRRSEALASLESQVQEIPRASPKKEENGGKKNDRGDKNVTPSPSYSSVSSNSSSMVTMPISLWKMKSSQVVTFTHLESSHTLWNDSIRNLSSNERHYWNIIDNLITKKFDWGCPLHIASSLIHLSHFINIAVSWMRAEYEAERNR